LAFGSKRGYREGGIGRLRTIADISASMSSLRDPPKHQPKGVCQRRPSSLRQMDEPESKQVRPGRHLQSQFCKPLSQTFPASTLMTHRTDRLFLTPQALFKPSPAGIKTK